MSTMTTPNLADDEGLGAAVARAKQGDRQALEHVVRALQDDVYRLALRMTGHPEDASDACQEILIKVITRLDSFRGESSIRTWAYRIAVRHVLDRRKGRVEALALDFERFGVDLLDGLAAEPDGDPMLAEEVKLGCTLAMLTCLDREHRLAYILGDVFDLAHRNAADFCEVSEETYRQRLSRARRALETFTESFCGIVNERAPCSCAKRVARAEELGRLHRDRPQLAQLACKARDELACKARDEMESLHATAQLMRSHPAYMAPDGLLEGVRAAIEGVQLLQE
jgi:RNA polymerase sigma factor (sigma-70 family)